MRIGLIFHNFGGYHVARLRGAAQVARERGWTIEGIEIEQSTTEHPWGAIVADDELVKHTVEPGDAKLSRFLSDQNFDALAIPGWGFSYSRKALAWCRRNRKPAVLMSESKFNDEPRSWWKEWLKSGLVRQFSSAIVGAQAHEDYLVRLGMERSSIHRGYDIVDNDYFAKGADEARENPATARARTPAIPGRPFFLSASRFIERKNLETLLYAYAEYLNQAGDDYWELILAGSGQTEPRLFVLARELKLEGKISFPGFISYKEMPAWYGLAGGFVHPARAEQWGLVVNEAMAAGLPVAVSRTCGCFPELIDEGKTGYGFNPGSVSELAELLIKIAKNDQFTMALAGRRHVADKFGPHHFGKGLLKAVEASIDQ
ncbi:MAG: 1,2-diacylglycerol 3-alpha-glucosyltransferase [Verrucomicrobiales bacterium]